MLRNVHRYFWWVNKNPSKFPPNFPAKNQSPTCRSAGRKKQIFADFCRFSLFPREQSICQERKSSLNIKFLGGIFLGHQGPRRRDIPDKNFVQVAFFCCFRQGVAGMSRGLGREVPGLEKLYASKLWADFSFPTLGSADFRRKPQLGICPLRFVPLSAALNNLLYAIGLGAAL